MMPTLALSSRLDVGLPCMILFLKFLIAPFLDDSGNVVSVPFFGVAMVFEVQNLPSKLLEHRVDSYCWFWFDGGWVGLFCPGRIKGCIAHVI